MKWRKASKAAAWRGVVLKYGVSEMALAAKRERQRRGANMGGGNQRRARRISGAAKYQPSKASERRRKLERIGNGGGWRM